MTPWPLRNRHSKKRATFLLTQRAPAPVVPQVCYDSLGNHWVRRTTKGCVEEQLPQYGLQDVCPPVFLGERCRC